MTTRDTDKRQFNLIFIPIGHHMEKLFPLHTLTLREELIDDR